MLHNTENRRSVLKCKCLNMMFELSNVHCFFMNDSLTRTERGQTQKPAWEQVQVQPTLGVWGRLRRSHTRVNESLFAQISLPKCTRHKPCSSSSTMASRTSVEFFSPSWFLAWQRYSPERDTSMEGIYIACPEPTCSPVEPPGSVVLYQV